MIGFDILDKNQSVLGNLLIEASAGTGKTFTIEHTVLRLVQDEKIPLHKILLLTFTNASQEDLMGRVFSRLKKSGFFGFLEEMPILTFQKFIGRFNKKEEEFGNSTPFYIDIESHLQTLTPYKEFGPTQLLGQLFSPTKDSDASLKKLLEQPAFDGDLIYFEEAIKELQTLLSSFTFEKVEKILVDLKTIKDEDRKIVELFYTDIEKGLDLQLTKKNWGWMKFVPENVRAKKTVVFPREIGKIQHLCNRLRDPKAILALFAKSFVERTKRPLGSYSLEFDLFIEKLKDLEFRKNISERFNAVIVDEFQDTDPRQWQILETLFLNEPHIKTFMVVGDPKQSIYRFRNADYTSFFAAKETLAEGKVFQLTTAYRSSIRLTDAINSFFVSTQSPFHPIEYIPVLAGRKDHGLETPLDLVIFDPANEESLFPWILTLLQQEDMDPNTTAVLVRHRYQATELEHFLKTHGIPVKRVDKTPLKDRLCFQQFRLLIDLINNRFDNRAIRAYHFITKHELPEEETSYLSTIEEINEIAFEAKEGNFTPFIKALADTPIFPWLVKQPLAEVQDVEDLYNEIYYSSESITEQSTKTEGVELITTFSSKGLEYETVITLALATDAKKIEPSEEDIRENMRLLYVAFTRAKERLIVPVVLNKKSTVIRFLQKLTPIVTFESLTQAITSPYIRVLKPHIAPTTGSKIPFSPESYREILPPLFYPEQKTSTSFSSLEFKEETIEKAIYTEGELPLGIDSGLFIHKILEKIFADQSRKITDEVVQSILDKNLFLSPFKPYRDYILKKVQFVLNTSINGTALKELHPYQRIAESPFSFEKNGERFEGIFDLLVFFENKIVIIDYKLTHPRNLSTEQLMKSFHYDEQGKIYLEAIRHVFPKLAHSVEMHFLFLRNEVHHVQR
ncbi:MAG: UvrD-helicase domain-containing protein [Chlamydiia bacterium]